MFGSSSGQVFSHFLSQFWLNLDTFMEKNIFGLVKKFLRVARVHKKIARVELGWPKWPRVGQISGRVLTRPIPTFFFLLLFWQSLIMMEKEQSKSYVPVRINHAWSKTLWKIFSSNHSSNWKKDISFLHLYSLHVPYIYWSETL